VRVAGVVAGVAGPDHPGSSPRGRGVGAAGRRSPAGRGGVSRRADLRVVCAGGVCEWSGGLPEDFREDADRILLAAQAGGADLADLAGLVAEMLAPVRPAGHRSG
jgi:hypothetical protein